MNESDRVCLLTITAKWRTPWHRKKAKTQRKKTGKNVRGTRPTPDLTWNLWQLWVLGIIISPCADYPTAGWRKTERLGKWINKRKKRKKVFPFSSPLPPQKKKWGGGGKDRTKTNVKAQMRGKKGTKTFSNIFCLTALPMLTKNGWRRQWSLFLSPTSSVRLKQIGTKWTWSG